MRKGGEGPRFWQRGKLGRSEGSRYLTESPELRLVPKWGERFRPLYFRPVLFLEVWAYLEGGVTLGEAGFFPSRESPKNDS